MMIVGVFIGLGFLTKTLQVLLVVPAFGLAYSRRRHHAASAHHRALPRAVGRWCCRAGWWVAIVELMPASAAALHRRQPGQLLPRADVRLQRARPAERRRDRLRRRWRRRRAAWGETGLPRMFCSAIGGQISWLIPSALILLARGLWLRGRLPRTDLRRAAYLVWGGWLVVTVLDLLAHGRHLPRVLHRRPGPGHRRPRRHGRRRGVGAPRQRRGHHRARRRHRRGCDLGLHPPLAHDWTGAGCASRCSPSAWRRPSSCSAIAGCTAARCRSSSPGRWSQPRRPGGLHAWPPSPRRTPARSSPPARRSRRRWRRYAGWSCGRASPRLAAPWAACSTPRRPAPRSSRPSSADADAVHLGRRGRRLAERRRAPARHRAAGHGDRRLQRQRPLARRWRSSSSYVEQAARSTTSPPAWWGAGRPERSAVTWALATRSRRGCSRTSPR